MYNKFVSLRISENSVLGQEKIFNSNLYFKCCPDQTGLICWHFPSLHITYPVPLYGVYSQVQYVNKGFLGCRPFRGIAHTHTVRVCVCVKRKIMKVYIYCRLGTITKHLLFTCLDFSVLTRRLSCCDIKLADLRRLFLLMHHKFKS